MSIRARKHLLPGPLRPLDFPRHLPPPPPPPPPPPWHHPSLPQPILSRLESCTPQLPQFNLLHARAVVTGLCNDAFAASRLLKFLTCRMEPPDLPRAVLLLSQLSNADVVAYNLLLHAFSRSPVPLDSFHFYRDLFRRGLRPNGYTLCFLLACCARGLAPWEGRQVHGHLCKMGLYRSVHAGTSLVHMYGEGGELEHAAQAFEEMPLRSAVTWATMIGAYATFGCLSEALRIVRKMMMTGVVVTRSAIVSTLCACANLGNLVLGRMLHGYATVKGLELNANLGTSLIDMYSKCGAMQAALKVFSMMPIIGVGSWNCMINGLAVNGNGIAAIDTFREMQKLGVQPNGVTFLVILCACCHSGLVETGAEYFSLMTRKFGLVPNLKHYGCMIDLYGRAGCIEEALCLLRAMPVKPDVAIWGALFTACRTQGDALLEELVAAQLVKIIPHETCGYLFLSNAYALSRRWDDVVRVRNVMAEMNMRKNIGYSTVIC